jgi:uncharacterized membrane protein
MAPGGLEDVVTYAALVTAPPIPEANAQMQFRVLLPYMAKPIYRVAKGHIGTWDPVMFSLLVVDAFFVALTALVLMIVVDRQLGSYTIALGAALLYMVNFAVPNLRLAGMVDAGEGFFLMALVWCLSEEKYWALPILGAIGATAKESFVVFLIVFSLSWWLCSRRELRGPWRDGAWMAVSWIVALASMTVLQWRIAGAFQSPVEFGMGLHQNSAYFSHFVRSLGDRNLWYIFFWLLPLSLVRLRRLPLNWRIATAATSVTAFVLDAYYGRQPGTVGRALFSVAGPLLTASVAILLFTAPRTTRTEST